MSPVVRQQGDQVVFSVHVVPRASREGIAGIHGDSLKIRLTAPPVEGAANAALLDFLATRLGVPRRQVEIAAGEASRRKLIAVSGLSPEEVEARLLG